MKPKICQVSKGIVHYKRRLQGNEKVSMIKNVSSFIKQNLPQKCQGLSTFIILCQISHSKFENAILDMGALINVMPTSVYTSLGLGRLKQTGVLIN